jgi:molybdopterin molybdotransferase
MISFAEAKQRLLDSARPITDSVTLPLAEAIGRIVAEDLLAPITVPPFANAAMDGYALRAADVPAAEIRLPVSQRIAAGSAALPLPPATAARIFTGAPLPEGADTVVMQEYCMAEGEAVIIKRIPLRGEHVRAAGSAMRAGEAMIAAGERLSAAALGLIASVGIAEVTVLRPLRVAVLFTGSELVEPGQPLAPGKIYNANRYLMLGFLRELGCEVTDQGIIVDDREATRAALRRAAAEADLVLTSGGMSEGDEDHVVASVRAEGRLDVWKIAAKPGKPLAFGSVEQAAFIGLPGNPVSVWSGLLTLVAPFVRRCQGMGRTEVEPLPMRADFDYTVKGDRLEFVRVRRNTRGGLDVFPSQDSAVIASAVWADGLVAVPAGGTVKPGDVVDFMPGPAWRT